jgi:hypothetical protein
MLGCAVHSWRMARWVADVTRISLIASETDVQRAIIATLALMRLTCVHVPNGAHLSGGKAERMKQMARLKADGLRSGFPDMIVLGTFAKVGFIETKRSDGGKGLSQEQILWREWLRANEHKWAMCLSVDDAVQAVKDWGWVR